MYSGQLENVQSPIGTLAWVIAATGVACLLARSSVPSMPQPASEEASSSEPPRPRNCRRVLRSVTGDHERVLRAPGELHLAADGERVGLGALGVLGEHIQLLARGGLDHVLDRDAQEG